MSTVARRYLGSTVAAYGIQLVRLVFQLGTKMALARLVLAEGHGVYELALRIVTLAAACRDLGLPYQLVRDARRPYGTIFRFVLLSGAVLTGAVMLFAPLSSALTPELPPVLRVLALWILLDGLVVVPRAFFERELRIRSLVLPEIAQTVVLAAVSVGLAAMGWGVWSFVVADLVATAALAAFAWRRAWGQFSLAAEPGLLRELLQRSRTLFQIWITLQLVTYLDVYIVKAYGDLATVGFYARSYGIAFLVASLVWPRALFSALVAHEHDPPRLVETFRLGTVQLLGMQVVASYFLLLNAELTIRVMLGPGWEGAVPLLRLLAFVPFFDQFAILGGELLKARHRDRAWLGAMLLNLVSLVVFGIVLTRAAGAPGMAVANYLLLGNVAMALLMRRELGAQAFRWLLADLARVYLIPLPLFAATLLLAPASWARFAAGIVAAAAAVAALAWLFRARFRAYFAHREPSSEIVTVPGGAGP